MGFDNKYPYTDFHEINLDWLLGKVKGIDDRFVAIEEAVAALREDLDIQTGRIDAALDAITFIQNHYPAMIASQYDESRQYDPGEIAIYDNELYICLPGETPGPWNGNFWNKTSLGDELGTIIIKVNDIILPDLTNINNVLAEYGTLLDDMVETYDPNFTYFKNNFVKYEDHIYMVMAESTTNPPTDTADWDPVTFANVFSYYINNLNVFVPEFQDNITYHHYDYVRYNNFVYYCKETTFSGAWDPSKWENCVLSMDLAFRMRAFYEMFGELFGWFASYDDAYTYNMGDVVNYNGTLYECIADNVTGVWDASKWQAQKVTDAMTDLNKMENQFPVSFSSGNPIEISNVIGQSDQIKVYFTANQSGTGTPTPVNIRDFDIQTSISCFKNKDGSADPENTVIVTYNDGIYTAVIDFETGKATLKDRVFSFNHVTYYGTFGFFNKPLFYVEIPDPNVNPIKNKSNDTFIAELLSNAFKSISTATTAQMADREIRTEAGTNPTRFYFREDTLTEEDLNAIFSVTPLVVICEVQTPIEINLSDIIKIDTGYNKIWTTGDTVEAYFNSPYLNYSNSAITKIGTFGNQDLCEFIYTEDGLTPSSSMTITTGFDFTTFEVNRILSIDVICYDTVGDTYESVQDERVYLTNTGDLQIDSGAINNTMNISVVIRFIKM